MALARGVARRLGLPVEERDIVARAAELHDIGKMAIPDAILNKPGPLDDREWRFMRRHTIIGEDILNVAPALQPVAALVRASHERWDGKGYPDGTAGDEIPRGARIVAVCDAFSAMVQDRPYQAGPERERGGRRDRALRGHELRPRRGRGVRGRDPLRSGAGVRRCLAPALARPRLPRPPRPRRRAAPGRPRASPTRATGSAAPGRSLQRARRRRRRRCWSAARRCATRGRSPSRPTARCWSPTRAPRRLQDHARGRRRPPSRAAAGCDDPVGHRAGAGRQGLRRPTASATRCCGSTSPTAALTKVADVRERRRARHRPRRQAARDRRARGAPRRSRDRRGHDRRDGRAARPTRATSPSQLDGTMYVVGRRARSCA